MKTNIPTYLIITFLITSCTKDFKELNIDPNNPSQVPTEYLLTSAEQGLSYWVHGSEYEGLILAQYWAQNNYSEESRYHFRPADINYWWGYHYRTPLKDLQEIIDLELKSKDAQSAKSNNKVAIASILKAFTIVHLSDVWGAIPYKEALQGNLNRTPKWDSQKDIYEQAFTELKEAIGKLNDQSESFANADIIYQGDVSKWRKYAHSLIMRMAMRISDIEPALAEKEFEDSFNKAIAENNDNAYFKNASSQPNTSSFYAQRISRCDADFGLSDILIDKTLKPLNDPRLPIFADERVTGGGYFGRPFGQSSAKAASESPDLYSQPSGAFAVCNGGTFKSTDIESPEFPSIFFTYSEICFMMAEAKERTWNVSGSAEEWYNKAITASLNQWGIIDQPTIDTYLSQPQVNYSTASGNWKQKIGVQKWIALFTQGMQAWAEWRRLDFQKLELPVDGAIDDVGNQVAPMRLLYPTDEQSLNSAGYAQGVNLLGGPDRLFTRLWWDVK